MLAVLHPPANTQDTDDSFLAQKALPPTKKKSEVYIILTEGGVDSRSKSSCLSTGVHALIIPIVCKSNGIHINNTYLVLSKTDFKENGSKHKLDLL